ncbi:MAG: hypothetical protein IJG68_04440 [Bacilli bacterium]|nr:hypothetical protein [Bacilli bacterium]
MSHLPHNYKKYPEWIEKPEVVSVLGDDYRVFGYHFKGLRDFYELLKQNPSINYQVWSNEDKIASITGRYDFAGRNYHDAVEMLIEDMDPGYQEYLRIQKQMKAKTGYSHKYKTIPTIAGGVVDPVSYTVGSPTIYKTGRLIKKPKFITVDLQIAYYWGTDPEQVFNRALIITNLIRALERNGYSVDVNSFMVAQEENEIVKVVFEVKKQGQRTNYQTLYKSLVDVEFFRRLCFRLMEISDVTENWVNGYGQTSEEDFVRDLLKLKKEDIYFDQPRNMGIRGRDLGFDFERAITSLGLEDKIDMKREKEILQNSVKVFKR